MDPEVSGGNVPLAVSIVRPRILLPSSLKSFSEYVLFTGSNFIARVW